MPLAALPGLLQGATGIPISAYKADISFKGSSVYYGFQLNGSYEINDMFSVAVGARYISAVNTYEGGIRNIQINPNTRRIFQKKKPSMNLLFKSIITAGFKKMKSWNPLS